MSIQLILIGIGMWLFIEGAIYAVAPSSVLLKLLQDACKAP